MKNKLAVIAGFVAFGLCQVAAGHSFYQSITHYKNAQEFQQKFDPEDSSTNEYSLEALFERQRGYNDLLDGFFQEGLAFPAGWLTYLLFKKEEDNS